VVAELLMTLAETESTTQPACLAPHSDPYLFMILQVARLADCALLVQTQAFTAYKDCCCRGLPTACLAFCLLVVAGLVGADDGLCELVELLHVPDLSATLLAPERA